VSDPWLRTDAYKAHDENDHNTLRPDGLFWWVDFTRKQQREIVSVKAQTRKAVNSLADSLEGVLYIKPKVSPLPTVQFGLCRFCYKPYPKGVELRQCSFCNNYACSDCRYCFDGAIGSRCCTVKPRSDKKVKS
jgi:hypothetical protein